MKKLVIFLTKWGKGLLSTILVQFTRGTIGYEHKQTLTLEFYHRLITPRYWDVISSTVQC